MTLRVLFLGLLSLLVTVLMATPALATEDLVLAGADALYRGDVSAAEQAFSEVVRRDSSDDFAMNQLGLTLARQERFDEARVFFSKVADRSLDNVFSRLWLGIISLHDDDPEGARGWFQDVLQRSPDHPGALYLLGVEAASRRDLAQAVELFARAGRSGHDDADVQFRLAEAYRGLELSTNARLHYLRALEINPRHAAALVGLGWLYYNLGQRNVALKAWTRALTVAPRHDEARASLAAVLVREGTDLRHKGHLEAAQARFQQALEYDSGNKAALFYLR
ncbi:tetratricopeptide repeat protein [Desulfovibrio ferrophilus]|uniref:Tetratricopeptide TPR_2 repeat protein n=1 Tax=Desulfovibrio ferrophilus TaxID=241368 RepID=A0A2Z6AW42_9BACT|nr:tetratricopeptide repeat protein [Desulfovibrio ferrophilus]BBD07462.1 tetratricopeptide TPR_2 repeat protein [Desulfovibrio ferrophilus]